MPEIASHRIPTPIATAPTTATGPVSTDTRAVSTDTRPVSIDTVCNSKAPRTMRGFLFSGGGFKPQRSSQGRIDAMFSAVEGRLSTSGPTRPLRWLTPSGHSVDHALCPHAHARGAAPIPTSSDADRPAPAGSVALRLLAEVDISFWRNCCSQIRRRTMELGIGADADVGFAWSGGGDGAGAGRAQRGTGSSATIAKFYSTDSGGEGPPSLFRHCCFSRHSPWYPRQGQMPACSSKIKWKD